MRCAESDTVYFFSFLVDENLLLYHYLCVDQSLVKVGHRSILAMHVLVIPVHVYPCQFNVFINYHAEGLPFQSWLLLKSSMKWRIPSILISAFYYCKSFQLSINVFSDLVSTSLVYNKPW